MDKIKERAEKITAHQFSLDALCKGYDTDTETGLTTEQAKKNLEKFGPNKLNKTGPKYQESYSEDYGKSANVMRNGKGIPQFLNDWVKIEEVVPGDIVSLAATGDMSYVPGDLRIIQIYEPVYVESYFLYKDSPNYLKEITTEKTSDDPLETGNLIFHGTQIFCGRFIAMVINTGDNVLLNDVGNDVLATPEIPDIDDEGLLASIAQGIAKVFKGDKDEKPGENWIPHEKSIENICEEFNTNVEKGLTTEQAAQNRETFGKNNLKSLRLLQYTSCIRNGEVSNVPTKHLAVGDVVSLKAPFIVPADIVVIKAADDTHVDKSCLTGDSDKKVSATERHANPLESPNFVMAGSRLTSGSCDGVVVQVGKKTVWGKISGLGSTLEF